MAAPGLSWTAVGVRSWLRFSFSIPCWSVLSLLRSCAEVPTFQLLKLRFSRIELLLQLSEFQVMRVLVQDRDSRPDSDAGEGGIHAVVECLDGLACCPCQVASC